MSEELLTTSITIDAPPHAVFDVLADPASHAAIDGTGWVQEPLDGRPLTEVGQIFRMGMYHDNHPDGRYEIANKVVAFDAATAIAWEPGQDGPDGWITWGGWIWRYDLTPVEDRTEVTLTYDWSAVPQEGRDIEFPPFPVTHLDNSLNHLAEITARR